MGSIALMFLFPLLFLGLIIPSFDDHEDEPDDDVLTGTQGNDLLQGGDGDDTLFGGDGEDSLQGGAGADVLWAGEGDDGDTNFQPVMNEFWDVLFSGNAPALQSFVDANASFGGDGGAGNDYVNGGPGDDVLTGRAGDDIVRGSSGHDFLVDLQGANTLNGGFGNDELWGLDPEGSDAPDLLQGWAGDDDLLGDDGDTMEGGDGEDAFFTVWQPGDDPVTITDFDPAAEFLAINTSDLPDDPVLQLVDLADDAGMAVTLNGETMAVLQGVTAAQFQTDGEVVGNIRLVDRVGHGTYTPELSGPGVNWGGADSPEYDGSPLNDRIVASDSGASLFGHEGDDTLFGGAGDDYVVSGDGDDQVFAGSGNDTVAGFSGDDLIRGGAGADHLDGYDGNDTIYGDWGNDVLAASTGADALFGGFGNDTLWAGIADGGPDTLDGGAGDDELHGSAGDLMTGGAGNDSFASGFYAADPEINTITDFTPGEDLIRIQIYGPEITPGFVVQTLGATDSVIVIDGVARVVLQGITPAQIDPDAISVSHIN